MDAPDDRPGQRAQRGGEALECLAGAALAGPGREHEGRAGQAVDRQRAAADLTLTPPHLDHCARATVEVRPCKSQVGSGSLPLDRLPSAALVLAPRTGKRGAGRALKRLAATLRALPQPVIGRVHAGALWLDLRCLDDEAAFLDQLPDLQGSGP